MGYLLGFAPWIVFWVLFGRAPFTWVALAAAGVSLAVYAPDILRRDWKILDLGSLVFFLGLALVVLTIHPAFLEGWASAVSCLALLVITLLSLALGRPFTLQYARKSVPREFWDHPRFVAVNRTITWVWALCFAAQAASSAAFALGWTGKEAIWIVHPLALAGAAWFTTWYAALARRRGEAERAAAMARTAGIPQQSPTPGETP